jgi:uncharacterized protein (DUF924 family)
LSAFLGNLIVSFCLSPSKAGVVLFSALQADAGRFPDNENLSKFTAGCVKSSIQHRDVVQKWGRFPHRNVTIGRPSTEEEERALADGTCPKF